MGKYIRTRQGLQVPAREDGIVHEAVYFGKMPEKLIHDHSITDGAARLYAHMHWRYGRPDEKKGTPAQDFEAVPTMARAMNVSEHTILNRLAELEAKDWIIVIRQTASDGWRTSNFYHVFESQNECRQWRKDNAVDGSAVRVKVNESAKRKVERKTDRRRPRKAKRDSVQIPDRSSETNFTTVVKPISPYPDSTYSESLYTSEGLRPSVLDSDEYTTTIPAKNDNLSPHSESGVEQPQAESIPTRRSNTVAVNLPEDPDEREKFLRKRVASYHRLDVQRQHAANADQWPGDSESDNPLSVQPNAEQSEYALEYVI